MAMVPYLCCADAAAAIEFYTAVFEAVEVERWTGDDGRIGHAELTLAGQPLYLADEHPEIGVRSPRALGGTPVSLVLTVPDADATAARAVAAGATVERPVVVQDDGARAGWIIDPFGHRWNLQTPIEHVTPEELRDRVGDRYRISD
ncbi:VOC family protein [Actinoplanes aureus]|jgi:PhnB protein|uniref:VOC family protein n=1 Tax=Actinoplanes aureus TaxID=2792083 RepID=A0A931CH44_9ACTN|nr:VOC family protein [Actinoplanes aureus]MBG0568519.1 VOC family protein [Actinoplanes aureus]